MKKLFLALALAGVVFAGCNEDDNNTEVADGPNTEEQGATDEDEDLYATDKIKNQNSMAGEGDEALAEISFEKTDHNFGDVQQGEKVLYAFKFTNTGEEDLIIENAKASCGCTVPTWPKEPIAPGGTGEIPVEYDSKGKSGMEEKQVTLTANTDPRITTLKIKVNVIQ